MFMEEPVSPTTDTNPPTTVQIPLTQGYTAIIDAADYERVSQHKWGVNKCNGKLYAATNIRQDDGTVYKMRLHRFITGAPKGYDVDHVNHNGLDNRRCNLRVATRAQNLANQLKRAGTSSKYKGVCLRKADGKWQANIKFGKKHVYIGHFDNEVDAALAYDEQARMLYGEFASTNFPPKKKVETLNVEQATIVKNLVDSGLMKPEQVADAYQLPVSTVKVLVS